MDPIQILANVAVASIPIAVVLISVFASKAPGGPWRTRKTKRILTQVTELSETSGRSSKLEQAAFSLHKDALLKELAKMHYPNGEGIAALLLGLTYLAFGVWVRATDPEFSGILLLFGTLSTAIGLASFWVYAHIRRRFYLRQSLPSPLLTAHQRREVNAKSRKFFMRSTKRNRFLVVVAMRLYLAGNWLVTAKYFPGHSHRVRKAKLTNRSLAELMMRAGVS